MAHIQHLLLSKSIDSTTADDRPVNGRAGLVASELDSTHSDPVRGPFLPKELEVPAPVQIKHREDVKVAWNDLVNNEFCARSAWEGDALLHGLRWYMLQDMLFLRSYVYFKLGFYGKASWTTVADDFRLPVPVTPTYKGAPITKAIGYADTALDNLKTKLDIPESIIGSTKPDRHVVQLYVDYLLEATRQEDYFTLWIVTAPFIVLFVNVNADRNYGQLNKYSAFLDAHITPEAEEKNIKHWVDLFNRSCVFERNFWDAALIHRA
ncbi:hypothetical protein H0H92_005255 [Tricholoma furcatifolium]|nr:hypothetical protein H0H92_005255 [Tricholoma furcatifolium]